MNDKLWGLLWEFKLFEIQSFLECFMAIKRSAVKKNKKFYFYVKTYFLIFYMKLIFRKFLHENNSDKQLLKNNFLCEIDSL